MTAFLQESLPALLDLAEVCYGSHFEEPRKRARERERRWASQKVPVRPDLKPGWAGVTLCTLGCLSDLNHGADMPCCVHAQGLHWLPLILYGLLERKEQ